MGAKWPFQQFCWDTGQLALPSSHGVGTSSRHQHKLPPCASLSQPAPESRTHTQIPRSALPSTARPWGGEGRGLAALDPKTLCSFRKTLPQGSRKAKSLPGERGAATRPFHPSPQQGKSKKKKHHAPVILGGVDVPRGEDVQGQNVGVNE